MDENSDNPPPSPSISTVTTDSETETWEVVEDKDADKEQKSQQNPKITIDKAESTDNDDEDDADGKKKEKSSSLNVGSSSRVEDIKDGKISYDDFSDGISVISESEMECHHEVDTTLEDEPVTPVKKDLMLKSPMMVCSIRNEQMPLLEYLQQYFMNNQLASMAILALLVAVIGGLFCQIGMMFSSPATTTPTTCENDVNFLICENKLKEFERDNANLRIEISILQTEIENIRGTCDVVMEEQPKEDPIPVRTKAINGQYKGKRVKTKYDAFKRPPVAAGGEEETFIHVEKPLLVDEDEPPLTTWTDFIEPIQNLFNEGTPNDEIIVEDEVETNFEPIDIETETNPTLNELPEDEKVPVPEPNEKKFDKRDQKSSWKSKTEQYDKKDYKKSQKFDENPKRDTEKYQEKQNKDQKKRSKESSGAGEYKQGKKWQKNDENGSGENNYKQEKLKGKKNYDKKSKKNNEKPQNYKDNDDDNHHDKHKHDNSDEENDFWKGSHEKNYQKRRSNDRNESRKDSSGEKYKYDKRDSREKSSWHDDRMKNREKHRDRDNSEENWYVERKKNREKHRESREKDSNWYIERNLERELLRSREHDTSKERSK